MSLATAPCCGALAAEASTSLFDANGYRIARYRAPTPDSVEGGSRIEADRVRELVEKQRAILVDVMPAKGAGPDPTNGRWRQMGKHRHIPGSVWLPGVGAAPLDETMRTYFEKNLERLTEGGRNRALILYCTADCWMSWNAVKRAASMGCRNLFWLAEGSDGWLDWIGPLVDAPEPVPVSRPRLR